MGNDLDRRSERSEPGVIRRMALAIQRAVGSGDDDSGGDPAQDNGYRGGRGPGQRAPAERGPAERGSGEHGPGEHGPGEHGPGEHGPGEHGPGEHGPGEHGPGEHGPGEHGPGEHGPGDGGPGDGGPGADVPGERRAEPDRLQIDRAGPDPGRAARRGGGERQRVPLWLQVAAGWSWRVLLVGLLIYVAARIASALRIVVVPCVIALLLTALLQPLASRLKRTGMPNLLATWCALIAAIAILAGVGTLIGVRTSAEYPTLLNDLTHTGHQLEHWLAGPPFHIKQARLQSLLKSAETEISAHKSLVAGTVLTGGKYVTEILAGLILTLFVGFFLIKDGDRIWTWLTGFLSPGRADRVDRAGRAAWRVLVHYVRGTVLIAATHSVVIGVTLWILGVPLVIPLAAVVFLAAFVPLVGILVAGVLCIAVALGTKGVVAAVILLVVFLVEDQLDGHLLQPQVVGRIIRLHPLAVILVLAVGGILAGVPGAVAAVPLTAAIARAWPELRRPPEPAGVVRQLADDRKETEQLGEEHVPM